jgi:hypothetical protein
LLLLEAFRHESFAPRPICQLCAFSCSIKFKEITYINLSQTQIGNCQLGYSSATILAHDQSRMQALLIKKFKKGYAIWYLLTLEISG